MKKIYLALFLITAFISCKKKDVDPFLDSQTYNSKLRERAKSVGTVHNKGLDYFLKGSKTLITNNKVSAWLLGNGATIANNNSMSRQVLINSISYVNSNTNNDDPGDGAVDILQDVIDDLSPVAVEAVWDSEILAVDDEGLLTSREKNMVAEIKDVFSDGYAIGMSPANAATYFESRLQLIQTQYQNVVFDPNEGELYLGLLNLALSSNQYWHSVDHINSYYPNEPEPAIIQLDMIGYIVGWSRAVLNDYRAGNLHPSGQGRRMDEGVEVGLAASLTGWLKKFDEEVLVPTTRLVPAYNEPLFLPTPLPGSIIYWSSEGAILDTVNDYSQDYAIFQNPGNGKYYFDSSYTIMAADGYYCHPVNIPSRKIHQITNGSVVAAFQLVTSF
jgi:hypothetical protein